MEKKGVVVTGAGGKMGLEVVRQILVNGDLRIRSILDSHENPLCGDNIAAKVGWGDMMILRDHAGGNLEDAVSSDETDVVIDFSTPASALQMIKLAATHNKAVVVGVTGFTAEQIAEIYEFSNVIPIVQDYNFSVGICILTKLVEDLAVTLGLGYDAEIVETHHNLKKDAPSGTAIKLAQAIANGYREVFREVVCMSRNGQIGERPVGQIGIQSLRMGNIVGEHTIHFCSPYERIELTHKAVSKAVFAQGAVRSAQWVIGKGPGMYDLRDVLEQSSL